MALNGGREGARDLAGVILINICRCAYLVNRGHNYKVKIYCESLKTFPVQ